MEVKQFWDLKKNPITMLRDYPYSYIEKNEDVKRRSKLKTKENRKLRYLKEKNEKTNRVTNGN